MTTGVPAAGKGQSTALQNTLSCKFCGRSYKGRGIIATHNLATYNLEEHERACLSQQRRAQHVEVWRRKRTQKRVAEGAEPGEGQLGFPGFGVPREVM